MHIPVKTEEFSCVGEKNKYLQKNGIKPVANLFAEHQQC